MTPARVDQSRVAREIQLIYGMEADPVRELLKAIPLPGAKDIEYLAYAVETLKEGFPWASDLEAASLWPDLAEVPKQKVSDGALKGLTQHYQAYSALLGATSQRSSPNLLRLILLVCTQVWRDRQMPSATLELARACRSLNQSRETSGQLHQWLSEATGHRTLGALAEWVCDSSPKHSDEFGAVWTNHVRKAFTPLRGTAVKALPESAVSGDLMPPRKVDAGPNKVRGAGQRSKRRKRRTISVTRSPEETDKARQEGECPEEGRSTTRFSELLNPEESTELERRQERVYLHQNTWGPNPFLLLEANDCITSQQASLLAAHLLDPSRAATDDERTDDAFLMLVLLTGRTAYQIRNLRILTTDAPGPRPAAYFDIAKSAYVTRAIHPPGAWAPNVDQASLVESVTEFISLPVPKAAADLVKVLTTHRERSKGSLEDRLRRACRRASEATGIVFLKGRVRRFLSRHLQNAGNDIAATMLICNDAFGQSVAPLYYVSPYEEALRNLYRQVVAGAFGEYTSQLVPSSVRVGSRLLRSKEHVQERAESLRAWAMENDGSQGAHNRLVDYTVLMFIELCGCRATNFLGSLTRHDLDSASGLALLSDKAVDAAHAPRLAAMPDVLCRQLDAYLTQLESLAPTVTGAAQRVVRRAIDGTGPLFFRLKEVDEVMPWTVGDLQQRLPQTWNLLPRNASRTTIATAFRDLNLPPFLALVQLGHLESAGFPFSDVGPTDPMAFARAARPALNHVAETAGWRVFSGALAAQSSASKRVRRHLPLTDWTDRLAEISEEQRRASRSQRQHLRARIRAADGRAANLVADVLASGHPTLLTQPLLVPAGFSLDEDEVKAFQSSVVKACDGDEVLTYIALGKLRSTLKRLQSVGAFAVHVPSPWKVLRSHSVNPFFHGMMKAVSDLESIRQAARTIAPRAPSGTSDLAWRVAHATWTLLVFGGVTSFERALSMIAAAKGMQRPVAASDLALLPQGHMVEAEMVQGLPLLALANLRWREKSLELKDFSRDDILALMLQWLPAGMRGTDSRDTLRRLETTLEIANLLESSGLARMSRHPKDGSVPATFSEQLAWLDGDRVVPDADQGVVEDSGSVGHPGGTISRPAALEKMAAGTLYKRLVAVLPGALHDNVLPMTNQTIKAASRELSRSQVKAELELWAGCVALPDLVRALAHWAHDMLEDGTAGTEDPAYSTVHSYLTTVGGDMTSLLGGAALFQLDESELEQLFLEIVELKPSERAKALAAREIGHFYSSCRKRFELPEVDMSALRAYCFATTMSRQVDNVLVTPALASAVAGILALERADDGKPIAVEDTRVRRQARGTFLLLRQYGAREAEVLGARLRDVEWTGGSSSLRVRRNAHRRLKTRSSGRLLRGSRRLDPADTKFLDGFLEAEQRRFQKTEASRGFLFSSLTNGRDLSVRAAILLEIRNAMKQASGRSSERIHRLRHLVATERLFEVFVRTGESGPAPTLVTPAQMAAISSELGHRHWLTTVRCYCHLPWVFAVPGQRERSRHVDRRSAAFAMAVSPAAVDKVVQRSEAKGLYGKLLDSRLGVRSPSTSQNIATARAENSAVDLTELRLKDVALVLGFGEQGMSLGHAGLSVGLAPRVVEAIGDAAREFGARTGIILDRHAANARNQPKARRNTGSTHLHRLVEFAESQDPTLRRRVLAVARSVFSFSLPSLRGKLRLPKADADALRALLIDTGHPPELIEIDGTTGLVTLRVARAGVDTREASIEVKRILGSIWVHQRVMEYAALAG